MGSLKSPYRTIYTRGLSIETVALNSFFGENCVFVRILATDGQTKRWTVEDCGYILFATRPDLFLSVSYPSQPVPVRQISYPTRPDPRVYPLPVPVGLYIGICNLLK